MWGGDVEMVDIEVELGIIQTSVFYSLELLSCTPDSLNWFFRLRHLIHKMMFTFKLFLVIIITVLVYEAFLWQDSPEFVRAFYRDIGGEKLTESLSLPPGKDQRNTTFSCRSGQRGLGTSLGHCLCKNCTFPEWNQGDQVYLYLLLHCPFIFIFIFIFSVGASPSKAVPVDYIQRLQGIHDLAKGEWTQGSFFF